MTTQPASEPLRVLAQGGKVYSHVRKTWLVETPEERVRQEYLIILVDDYGFSLEQIAEEENLTGRGSAQARADHVIWRTVQDRAERKPPLVIVEYKSDNVTIRPEDYGQGDSYARLVQAPFFVTHNHRETKYWKVRKDRMPGYLEEISNIPHANASDREIEELLARLKVFKENEFADLLHKCHNVIRNREAHDPTKAFDETAKILFVKVWVEREMKRKRQRQNLFTVDFLESQFSDDPLNDLFEKTRRHYERDAIFSPDDRIQLKPETGREIVRLLQAYNLSDTSEDIKGIAFERFLGRTFRGEIGQFFTPRPIVEFMIQMIEPQEGEVLCDPASGSGGFLIRFFEIVRESILRDADRQYREYAEVIAADGTLDEAARAERLRERFAEIQQAIDQRHEGSRLWKLANRCIYGTDKNDRMARTSKMNMIMHGDGHGGVHHWNGFLNVNGIFPGRFDLILTNPPFGAKVEADERILEQEIELQPAIERHYREVYGEPYRQARNALKAAVGKPIANLFQLPKGEGEKVGKIKTEILFIERCLDLLKPGGRLGIVLPEGIFNNPSLAYVRQFVEDRAYLRAVVSLPQETFAASGASVKASLLFLERFSESIQAEYDALKTAALLETGAKYRAEREAETARLDALIQAAKAARDTAGRKEAEKERAAFLKRLQERISTEARALLKQRFNYPLRS